MSWFLGGILFLVLGYFLYGRVVEKILGPDDRTTPCVAHPDGVDFVPLPRWKNMLIQLLNIAGVGPVIGVILGIKFGRVALLIIPVGCVLMGATHDFLAGMMSVRMDGANLPKIVSRHLGRVYATVFAWAMVFLLLLCVTVFINVPANLIDKTWLPGVSFFWWAVLAIFVYYVAATLFPVDKIIGRVYPFFGALLIIGSAAISVALVAAGFHHPEILDDCAGFADFQGKNPLFPCLFVTIACGIVSGFHATQSPIVARTMRSEREGRSTFFGMMILEGVIAMIWAASALAIYNVAPENLKLAGPVVLGNVATHFLGPWMGGVTVMAIVVLAVTSGDTALRSSRLSLGEMLKIDQVKISTRVLTCLPLIVVVALLLWWSNVDAKSFNNLWNYFAWGNQMVSATTLMAASTWLLRAGRRAGSLVALLPGMFMTTVVVSFIFWTPGTGGQPWGLVPGGLPLAWAVALGAAVACAFAAFAIRRGRRPADSAETT
ncbi:MAG: carbon starvation protein A [Kiritimatiellae bacterium]|nr:carbon starvation protein A [Kiritimatiellia bacterium]